MSNNIQDNIVEQDHEGICKNHGGLTHSSQLRGFFI